MRYWVSAVLLLLLLPLFIGAYAYYRARQAEPAYSGELIIPSLRQPVTVRFGPHAIPHLEAQSQEDLFLAQGYIVASERMWQMDLMRRLARGRLAEVFGKEAIPVDRLFRTLGLERAARRNLAALSAPTRRYLEAYARGVNAYREHSRGRRPLEYLIARFDSVEWGPIDSIAIGEYMTFMLSSNYREELAYLRLAQRLGKRRALELFPTDEGIPAPDDARHLPDYTHILRLREPYTRFARHWGLPQPGPASNSWAVAGSRSQSGLPLLANDPHLAPSMPSIWYELELQAPGYHAAGTNLPGLPFVLIGHNEDLAWGLTTTLADTQDIFVERVTADGLAVERPGGQMERIAVLSEPLKVKGQSKPVQAPIRETSNGVILNDVLGLRSIPGHELVDLDTPYLLALRWNIELPDRGFDAVYGLNKASTVGEARAALRHLVHASQTVLIAHRDGTIAWQITGALPLRRKGLGTFPAPGWTGDYAWDGYVDRRRNPSVENPSNAMLVTANNRTLPLDAPVHVSRSWEPPYRAQRIEELLAGQVNLTAETFATIQLDRESIEARHWISALRAIAPELEAVDPTAMAIAKAYLLDWNATFNPDSRSAALFVRLRDALNEQLFGDELQSDLPVLNGTYVSTYSALQEAVRSGRSSFWDDIRTARTERPVSIWGRALRQAWNRLATEQQGSRAPPLGDLRELVFSHAFHRLPLLGRLFDIGPVAIGGDNFTINVAKSAIESPETPDIVPSYRFLLTPGQWSSSRGTQALGQSGHRFSRYRTDQLQDWLQGRLHAWHWNGPPTSETIGTLKLLPRAGDPARGIHPVPWFAFWANDLQHNDAPAVPRLPGAAPEPSPNN